MHSEKYNLKEGGGKGKLCPEDIELLALNLEEDKQSTH